MIVITVYDRITGHYSDPYTFINLDDCKRRLCVAYRNNAFANDLEVYSIGDFDNTRGILKSHERDFMFTIPALISEVMSNA